MALFLIPGTAHAKPGCRTHSCLARTCKAQTCKDRVEWKRYRRAPMPWCTWGPESGGNYRALNRSSMAGGKYQMLPSTFHAYGGWGWPHLARPLIQERIARRVLRGQGLGAWVMC